MTLDSFVDLQGKALERLTEDRRQSGPLGEDVEEMLNAVGVFWDMIEEEYFNIEAFQIEIYKRLAQEYVSQKDA